MRGIGTGPSSSEHNSMALYKNYLCTELARQIAGSGGRKMILNREDSTDHGALNDIRNSNRNSSNAMQPLDVL